MLTSELDMENLPSQLAERNSEFHQMQISETDQKSHALEMSITY